MTQYTPPAVPTALRHLRNWLVWRLLPQENGKSRKVPYYVSGPARPNAQGTPEDRALLVTYDEAAAQLAFSQSWDRPYTGLGFAPLEGTGVVALDFDDCVSGGVIAAHVEALCDGTYTEFSPSGNGVRAFFLGDLLSRKDVRPHMKGPWPIEVFGHNGFVTVTGNVTPTCDLFGLSDHVAPCSAAVYETYRARGWNPMERQASADEIDVDARALMMLSPTLGLDNASIALMLADLPADLDYDTWLKVGMAVHHETHGEGFALWDRWSQSSPKYTTEKYGQDRWRSFGRNASGTPVTMAWVKHLADESKTRHRYEVVDAYKAEILKQEDEYLLREKVCARIRRDAGLDEVAREKLAQALQAKLKTLGTKLPIGECRDMVTPLDPASKPTVLTPKPLTEFGMADRFVDQWGHELMYVPEIEAWYCWTGIYWRRASSVEIEFRAKETVKALSKEADDHQGDEARKRLFEFCAYAESRRMVANIVLLAASNPRVMVPIGELDKNTGLFGVHNGVVELASGSLLPAQPEHRITKVGGCEYNAAAPAPLWEKTLNEVFSGDAEMVDYFQRTIGYAVMGNPTEDLLFIPFGNGANGKSTVLGTIRRALGHYARTADASTFVSDGKSGGGAGGAREDLLRLKGARFVYVNEPDENGELREGAVKSMTGGDAITARGLYVKDSVEIVPSWVVFMPTNHKPIVKGSDNGIWRRLVLLPFTRNFEADEVVQKDPKREEKLAAELQGVLAWIVRGAMEYQRRGLVAPRSVAAARESYRTQMDLLAEWLEDCCDIGPDLKEESGRLWSSWESFAKNRGILNYVRSSVALGRRLDMRFPAIKGNRGLRFRSGLRLKRDFGPADVAGGPESVAGEAGEDLF